MRPIDFSFFVATVIVVLLTMPDLSIAQPVIKADDKESHAESRTGHFQLKWEYEGEASQFTVEEANNPEFRNAKVIYQGADLGRSMSGVLDGTYYFRVRAGDGEWSAPVKVTVRHYELSTAFLVLAIGAIVLIATVGLIIGGHIRHRKEFAEKIHD